MYKGIRHWLAFLAVIGSLALTGASATAAVAAKESSPESMSIGISKGDWLFRIRGLYLAPQDSGGRVKPDLTTGSAGADDDSLPEIDFTYMLTDHLGLELILATSQNNLVGKEGLANLGVIADTRILPPTLTLQFHPFPKSRFRPYVGIGVNYTIFYDEESTASLVNTLGETNVDIDDSFGLAAQAGIDIQITDRWFLNFDFKWVEIEANITLTSGGTKRTVDVDLDPFIWGIGVGWKF